MDETIYIIYKVLFNFALEVWFSIHILRYHRYIFENDILFLSLKIDFVLTNGANPHKMAYYAAFPLGPHCLQKYAFLESLVHKGVV